MKPDGGSAFPVYIAQTENGFVRDGISIRDYFAAKAMQGLLAANWMQGDDHSKMVAEVSFIVADAMIAERMK